MPKKLRRITGFGDLHYITCSCYQQRVYLGSAERRNIALRHLGAVREECGFALIGYVFMPEHIHLMISETGSELPEGVMQLFKERVADEILGRKAGQFWQHRYYDYNVHTLAKMKEKIHYMHANPVRRRLVKHPGDWPWSSWSFYYRGKGMLAMDKVPEPWASLEED
jgi:putative transposase